MVDVIKLPGTDIETTPLGYGCASLMRLTSGRRRQSILAAAYDGGVRYFDVARMYGLGRVESEVGRFLRGRRDKVVVATKFGIEVKPVTGAAAAIQVIGRYVLNKVPFLRAQVRKRTGNFYVPKDFSVASARASLEQSLKALGTDYVDILLLHEPTVAEIGGVEIADFLQSAKDKGLIRAWGVAGYPEQIEPVCSTFPSLANVIQIPNDVVSRQLDGFLKYAHSAFVTFSPIAEALSLVDARLQDDPASAARWSEKVGIRLTDRDNLSKLLLGYCLHANSRGVVLFSSMRQQGVSCGIEAWRHGFSEEQVRTFSELVRNEISSDRPTKV